MANYDDKSFFVSRQFLISTRGMALNILYDPHRKISLYDRSWFVAHEHLSIIISCCLPHIFCPVWVRI